MRLTGILPVMRRVILKLFCAGGEKSDYWCSRHRQYRLRSFTDEDEQGLRQLVAQLEKVLQRRITKNSLRASQDNQRITSIY